MDNGIDKMGLCGIVILSAGGVKLYYANGEQRVCKSVSFEPFLWISSKAKPLDMELSRNMLSGPDTARIDTLVRFANTTDADLFVKKRDKTLPYAKFGAYENQFLALSKLRMFEGISFSEIRRTTFRIRTSTSEVSKGRVIAISMSGWGGFASRSIKELSDDAEADLIKWFVDEITTRDPDIIESHDTFRCDLPDLYARAKKLKINLSIGRDGLDAEFRKSRIKLAERIFGFIRCDVAGRTVVDTSILAQIYDVSVREMATYTLSDCAEYFAINQNLNNNLTEAEIIAGNENYLANVKAELNSIDALSERLLPTYLAQSANFPLTLQECILRGTGAKVEAFFLEKYLERSAALPMPIRSQYFEGALSQSFKLGTFKNILHYDIASLYPSLILLIGKCPKNDYLGVFVEQLKKLREYRLKYKNLAKTETDVLLAKEYNARQQSFKILINSFYGYLGLNNATFGDVELAQEIARKGREILALLIESFSAIEGCEVLEADTDGIYIASDKYFTTPDVLLAKVLHVLPAGIDLEFDGAYDAMVCYKAKNYALLQGNKVLSKGSSFRNRSTEPILRRLTDILLRAKLSGKESMIFDAIEETRKIIASGNARIDDLAKSESINKSIPQYRSEVADGQKRRSHMEAAGMLSPFPEVGDKITYYIASGGTKRSPDWQSARPLSMFDKDTYPYDVDYYLKKLKDWQVRYADLIDTINPSTTKSFYQPELF